jgi:hypothetical protein
VGERKIGNGELAKDVVEDRGRAFDLFVSLDRAGRLEAGAGECDELVSTEIVLLNVLCGEVACSDIVVHGHGFVSLSA